MGTDFDQDMILFHFPSSLIHLPNFQEIFLAGENQVFRLSVQVAWLAPSFANLFSLHQLQYNETDYPDNSSCNCGHVLFFLYRLKKLQNYFVNIKENQACKL